MLTIDKLRDFGADVDEGIVRCMNKEDFYLMLINKTLGDTRLSQLEEEILNKNYHSAFEIAHILKGMYSNLSLTPLADPISEITELLRNRTDTDYSALINEAKSQFHKLCSL